MDEKGAAVKITIRENGESRVVWVNEPFKIEFERPARSKPLRLTKICDSDGCLERVEARR
jgi:hypothetical protein